MQRRGFFEHCRIIAGIESEMLLKAIALKGEKADWREVMRDLAVDAKLKQTLGNIMITNSTSRSCRRMALWQRNFVCDAKFG